LDKTTTPKSFQARLDRMTIAVPQHDAAWPRPFDSYTLANALGIGIRALWFYVLETPRLYTKHAIPKKSGKMRILHVPDTRLAHAQRRVLRTFFDNYPWPEHVSAYVLGRSPIDAARAHAGRPFLAVVDLKDFFPSTKRRWVREAVQQLLELGDESTEILATMVTAPWEPGTNERYRVPQGAPTSGAVANLVAVHRLDPRILQVCERFGMTYTRYADDLAFSRETPVSPSETDAFLRHIIRAVKQSGYRVNYEKVRVQRRNRQQRLLGMSINAFPNIPKRDYRRMRAMVNHIQHKGYAQVASEQGYESGEALESYVDGILSYYQSISPSKAAQLRAGLSASTVQGASNL